MPSSFQGDVARVANHAEDMLKLADARHGDEYYSLPLCVLDAVFSIGVRYEAVRNVVARYCADASVRKTRQYGAPFPDRTDQESITRFCARLRSWGTSDQVADRLGSRQRTSTHPTSSILKAEAALRFAEQLRANRIEHLQDMAELSAGGIALAEGAVRTIPGQHSGISWSYFRMLSGTEDQVKPDRMLLGFVAAAVGRQVSTDTATQLVRGAAAALQSI
jgi:hypothetical protein